ncbi:MAG: tetratricopeptide repeat protein [Paracoccaceae bacterium]
MRLISTLLIAALPLTAPMALAAGSDDSAPPAPTQTTTECKNGQVFDDTSQKCVDPQSGALDDDSRFRAVRELAWAGRYDDATRVLAAMTEGQTDRVMTYRGFILRKSGQVEEGIAAYEAALVLNPGNILTHSYYGQLLVEMNEIDAARSHLQAIRDRGGIGTWAEIALARAIDSGLTYSF